MNLQSFGHLLDVAMLILLS